VSHAGALTVEAALFASKASGKNLNVNDSREIASEDPLELFDTWLRQAQESKPNDPNGAALATSTRDSVPSVRMVPAKRVGKPLLVLHE
jgi:pyridoxine/pyridoxamine 5'-phosphate oxidase